MKHLILAICCVWVPVWAHATHVLGGEMFYDKLAGDQYRITLKLYRDCGPGNANGTGFDGQATLAIYDGTGAFQFSQGVMFPGEEQVPLELDNPCLLVPPIICAAFAEYVTILSLPPNATGYVISYQRCCRTPTMTNLPPGVLQGLTCTVRIPPAASGENSSPRFNEYPPIALCLGQDMVFDHSAVDPDGDELVYDLFTPFAGGTANDPAPLAAPPPYANIVWGPGYSGAVPMDGAPGLAIDASSGELTVHPTLLGSFTVGVRVQEFRDGVLLSASIRDLRFDVVACEAAVASAIEQQGELCAGLTVQMLNNSSNAEFWHWDFGVEGTDADTSDLAEPTWTYADSGTYAITLIAAPGWPCADTSVSIFSVHEPLDPVFSRPAIACVDAPMVFEATGRFTPNAIVSWDLGDQAAPVTAMGATVSTTYIAPGTHPVEVTVQEFGCEASYADSATAHPRITLQITTDTAGCVGAAFAFSAEATAWTPVALSWELGDGTVLTGPSVVHDYAAPGVRDVSLTASTSSGCMDELTVLLPGQVEIFPLPVAEFTVHPTEVSLLNPVVNVTDHSQEASTWEYAVAGELVEEPSFVFEFEDAGWYDITQTVTSGSNCSAYLTRTVHVTDHLVFAPDAFTPDGDGVNDEFLPSVKGARLYELVILDRWGIERFRTTDPEQGWSGDGLPQGMYVYRIRLAEFGAYRKEYSGHVTLLR